MRKLLRILTVATSVAFAPAVLATTTTTTDFGSFSVAYDSTSFLGAIAFSTNDGAGQVSVGWRFPTNSITSTSGPVSVTLPLPDVLISANPGYVLGGPITTFFGSFTYLESADAATSMQVTGQVATENGQTGAVQLGFSKAAFDPFSGTLSATESTPIGTFSSFHFFGGSISATANVLAPGGFAQIQMSPDNIVYLAFSAAAVPEPDGGTLAVAGAGLIALILRRRRVASR